MAAIGATNLIVQSADFTSNYRITSDPEQFIGPIVP